jgi:hypothetical protein
MRGPHAGHRRDPTPKHTIEGWTVCLTFEAGRRFSLGPMAFG